VYIQSAYAAFCKADFYVARPPWLAKTDEIPSKRGHVPALPHALNEEGLCITPHARLILRTLLRLCCERVQTITILEAEERVEHEATYDRRLGYESLKVRLTSLKTA
jgi:hypothetical protein